MSDPLSTLGSRVRAALISAFGEEHGSADPAVHRSAFADYQADVALRLAKPLRRPPLEIAKAIAAQLQVDDICSSVTVSPPGFVNFTLTTPFVAALATHALLDPNAGIPPAEAPETVVIDYSSPNVAKEMHVGHLRSTIIGDAIARTLSRLGHRVIRQNHLGDWGTPFGMLIEHLCEIGAEEAARELSVGSLNEFYQAARQKFDASPEFAERARRRVVLLQSGDEATLEHYRTLVAASRRYFQAVYERLGVLLQDDDVRGESFYNDLLPEVARELEQQGLASVDQGALCVFLPEFKGREGEPVPLIVRKSDGGYGYAATDLAALRFRTRTLGAARVIVVVGAPQQQHLAMIFATGRRAGWLHEGERAEHVAFGSVLDASRKMFKTRSGGTVRLTELIDEAIERAEAAVREKNPDLSDTERQKVARQVGIGAIKYGDLSSDRIKDYVFDYSRMIAFEGNTGGYLQYAHARICSILRKAALQGDEPARILIEHPAERALALELGGFGDAVGQVASSLQPHRLCTYLYGLATAFTTFYENCPVLKAEGDERASRLALCRATRRVLAVGLDLLGIEAPDYM